MDSSVIMVDRDVLLEVVRMVMSRELEPWVYRGSSSNDGTWCRYRQGEPTIQMVVQRTGPDLDSKRFNWYFFGAILHPIDIDGPNIRYATLEEAKTAGDSAAVRAGFTLIESSSRYTRAEVI